MDKILDKLNMKHLKIGAVAAVVLKVFGLGKTLLLLLGALGGYLFARKMHEDGCDCDGVDLDIDLEGSYE